MQLIELFCGIPTTIPSTHVLSIGIRFAYETEYVFFAYYDEKLRKNEIKNSFRHIGWHLVK